MIQHHIYPLPYIQEILNNVLVILTFEIRCFNAILYFELDPESLKFCVVPPPFGRYKLKHLPLGIKQSSDIAQEVTETLLCNLDYVWIYIDNFGCFPSSFTNHIHPLGVILNCGQHNGFTGNPSECEWVVQETYCLGYWWASVSLTSWSKKINAIIAVQAPINTKQVCSLNGAIIYYCDMWPCHSYILTPLTNLTGKVIWKWTPVHQQAFDAIKAPIVQDVRLTDAHQ